MKKKYTKQCDDILIKSTIAATIIKHSRKYEKFYHNFIDHYIKYGLNKYRYLFLDNYMTVEMKSKFPFVYFQFKIHKMM